LQMGTSHFLGQNFSKPFDVKFLDKQNVETFAWQTSWGVSWRLVGALIMVHGDNKGLVLPPRVAPIQVVIVPIYYSPEDREAVVSKASEIKESLSKHNLRVHIDLRDQVTPGYKFHDWEMKGVPLRIEIGPKDIVKGKMVLVRRDNLKKTDLLFENTEGITSMLEDIQKVLFENAKNLLKEKSAFLNSPWCGEARCEEIIKESTGADIRVIPFDVKNENLSCIVCKKPSKTSAIFARSY
jgi:prolyl-tRNA synthetase